MSEPLTRFEELKVGYPLEETSVAALDEVDFPVLPGK